MTEGIIVALIASFGSIFGSVTAMLGVMKVKKDKNIEQNEEMMKKQKEANEALRSDIKDNLRSLEKSISNLETKYEKETAVISLKITELQKKQEQSEDDSKKIIDHETRIAVLEDKLKSAHHRIDSIDERLK